jgi:hypothetical protein
VQSRVRDAKSASVHPKHVETVSVVVEHVGRYSNGGGGDALFLRLHVNHLVDGDVSRQLRTRRIRSRCSAAGIKLQVKSSSNAVNGRSVLQQRVAFVYNACVNRLRVDFVDSMPTELGYNECLIRVFARKIDEPAEHIPSGCRTLANKHRLHELCTINRAGRHLLREITAIVFLT